MGWFSREAKSWTRTNPIASIGRARAGKPMTMRQMVKKMGAGQASAPSHLQRAYNTIRKLRAEIKQLKNRIWQLEKINAAQKPMNGDQVNPGSYAYFQATGKRILDLLNSNQDWSKVMVPGIRREVNGMLGSNNQWDAKRRRGVNQR